MTSITANNNNYFDDFGYKEVVNTFSNSGISKPANDLNKFAENVMGHFLNVSYNLRKYDPVYSEIMEVIVENCKPGWDGHDAKALSVSLLPKALKLSKKLDQFNTLPEITPEPDGEIALEWFGNDGSTFSISIGKDNKLRYAGLFPHNNKVYGVEDLDSPNEKILSGYIQKVISSHPDN